MDELKKDMKQYSPEYVQKTITSNLSVDKNADAIEGSYRDTVYQDRYQDTAYDDHYKDTVTYRDGTKN
ncbi:MAG: hypothetical protein AAF849_20545 [Bacteroidota bacterium]